MKQILFAGLIAGIACSANASDYGFEDYFIDSSNKNPQPIMIQEIHKPVVHKHKCSKCSKCRNKQIRVKDYTEVIEHYQVYEPVTVYQPVGTYSERHIINTKCNHCDY